MEMGQTAVAVKPGFWGPHIFDSATDAEKHFDEFWRQPGFSNPPSFSEYTLVRAKQITRYVGPTTPGATG